MKLRYTRSGGIANIRTSVEIDSEKLPEKKAKKILNLVQAARLSKSSKKSSVAPLPDDFHHVLEIKEGKRSYRIAGCDSECSPELLRLFDELQQEALSRKRSSE
jgi:Emfourin